MVNAGFTSNRRIHLGEQGRLPTFYWTGKTDLKCAEQAVGQVLEHGYGHHIQRLMVTGNLALLTGVNPREISDWYLGMYVDAIDWVTLPNTRIEVKIPRWRFRFAGSPGPPGRGVLPDLEVEPGLEAWLAGRDAVLEAALELAGPRGRPGP